MKPFDQYIEIKNHLNITYKNIQIANVIAIDLWQIIIENHAAWKDILFIFKYLDLSEIKTNKSILATYGLYKRSDHLELYNNIINSLNTLCVSNVLLNLKNKTSFIKKRHIPILRDVFIQLSKKKNKTLKQKLLIICRLSYYLKIIDSLEKINIDKINKYIAFSGIHGIENILTQFFKNKRITTYSLQHGITFVYKQDIPIDSLCYENFTSDFHLSWGQYTIDEYEKWGIPRQKLLLAGYPKLANIVNIKNNITFNKCLVLLSRLKYEKANIKLIEICKQIPNITFYIKLHPSLQYEYYLELINHIDNIYIIKDNQVLTKHLDNSIYDFAISINTTSYYEALINGLPTFRYNDDSFEQMYGYNDLFDSSEELILAMNNIKLKINSQSYQKDIKNILNYAIGIGIDTYLEILGEKK